MKKIVLIAVVVVLAGLAFAGAFLLSRRLNVTTGPAEAKAASTPTATPTAAEPGEAEKTAAQDVPRLEEKQLYELVREVRQKVNDCQKREQELDEQDRRLRMARQVVERESQDLENLRAQVATSVTRLKETQAELEKLRIAIDKDEAVNLKRMAAVYDKMDATAAGRILETMCANKQSGDAVRILHFMTDRTVAKVLAEFTDKQLAAQLSEQMKRVKG
jgi:flagellar motility protein MotE (MotC chaperone)